MTKKRLRGWKKASAELSVTQKERQFRLSSLHALEMSATDIINRALAAARDRNFALHDSIMREYGAARVELRSRCAFLAMRDHESLAHDIRKNWGMENIGRRLA